MSLPICRIGDVGFGLCSAHKNTKSFVTTIQTGASTVTVNGVPGAHITSIGIATCGHITTAIMGSELTIAEGLGFHRLSDVGIIAGGTYTMQIGSQDTISG